MRQKGLLFCFKAWHLFLLAWLVGTVNLAAFADQQDSAAFYRPDQVQEIHLQIQPADLE